LSNLQKNSDFCNIIFVILTCFYLTNFFLEKKNSAGCLLKTKCLMKICIFRSTLIFSSNYNVQFFHQLIILISFAVRDAKHTNFVEFRNFKIIYRRYAGLYFCICVDVSDNNLFYLEAIHNFVEVLNEYFHNVRAHHMFSRILNFLFVIDFSRKSCIFNKNCSSTCFKSNTVLEGLVCHFQNSIVVA
jgi:hypothetical protein